jgi:NAD(P)-dependent dehydrogenase (short-subunit alcohol dehydrogenase family)
MKKVMITGATSGIGQALLELYANEGHRVVACGRNTQKLASFKHFGQSVACLAFDITRPAQVIRASDEVDAIDILILNAGDCAYIEDIDYFDAALFDRIVTTNLVSMGYLLQSFLPKLSAGGQVVFISSSATLLPFPKAQAYGASKAGVDYLAESLRVDLAPKNIEVTLVHPGFVDTPLTAKNNFDMPFSISAEAAAMAIYKGVCQRKTYLHFPKKLTCMLKLLALLPTAVWQALVLRHLKS